MSDKDSLFGSPPPSPSARGRSPSLALPELPLCSDALEISQNVGTIALPGSHERSSELPVFINLALPSERPSVTSLRPPAPSERARMPPTRQRKSSTITRRTRSPSRIPSPAPHNPQTDRTLRDLVGLISHFEPGGHALAPIPSSRAEAAAPPKMPDIDVEMHPPGTQHNPIEVDLPGPADAVNSALVALAGTVASALRLSTPSRDVPSLSKPTVNTVLYNIKHDPKLIPVLEATYDYLGSVPSHPPQAPRSFSHLNTTNVTASSKKRRRSAVEKSQVPAGAGHWDVPFPFPPGKGPNDYPSQWQLDRGRRVLGELLGLFERAFAKVRGDNTGSGVATKKLRPRKRGRIGNSSSSTEGARSDFNSSTNGANDQSYLPSGSEDVNMLDHKRMNEWLSSVPALSSSSFVVESTGVMPSPSPSDPTPVSDSLQDLMALLGPDTFDNPSPILPDDTFDFGNVFKDVGLEEAQWQSLFKPGPTSQSINDITAFPIGFQGDQTTKPCTAPPQPQLHEFNIDPVLVALTQPQQTVHRPSLSVLHSIPAEQTPSTDVEFFSPASNLTSPIGSSAQLHAELRAANGECGLPGLSQEAQSKSLNSQSPFTFPTVSAPSSQAQSRHASEAPSSMHPPSGIPFVSKAQRKATLLAKAKHHRVKLLEAIERAKTERWATIIESGILRNLQTTDVSQ